MKSKGSLIRKLTVVFLFSALTSALGGGCSLTATRPLQEMSNAEAAIKAAKDLNADSLVPEIYRGALEQFFKAKREFRLKNFDEAKKFAVRAMRLAENAEFEAYRLGGATPEAAAQHSAPEGAPADADKALREGPPANEPHLEHEKNPPNQKPQGQTGPDATKYNTFAKPGEVPAGTTFNERSAPAIGAVPPAVGTPGVAPQAARDPGKPEDLWDRKKYDRLWLNRTQNPLPPSKKTMDEVEKAPQMEALGKDAKGQDQRMESISGAPKLSQEIDSGTRESVPTFESKERSFSTSVAYGDDEDEKPTPSPSPASKSKTKQVEESQD